MHKRGDISSDMPVYLIWALIILVVFVLGYLIITGKLDSALGYLKNLLRFG